MGSFFKIFLCWAVFSALGSGQALAGPKSTLFFEGLTAAEIELSQDAGELVTKNGDLFVRVKGRLKQEKSNLIEQQKKQVLTDEKGHFYVELKITDEDQVFEFVSVNFRGTLEPLKLHVKTPDLDIAHSTALDVSTGTGLSLVLVQPSGRVAGGQNHLPCIWHRVTKADTVTVAVYQVGAKGEVEIVTKTLPGDAELMDFPLRLEPGDYRWKVTAYGKGSNQILDHAEESFRVFPKSFESPEKTSISGGVQFTEFSYQSTNSNYAAGFSAGMTGPSLTASYGFKPWLGVIASWYRMDFNVYGTAVRNEDIQLGANYLSRPFALSRKFAFRFTAGVRGGIGFTPEVMGVSATAATVGTLTGWLVTPVVRVLFDYDEIGSFFLESRFGLALPSNSSLFGTVTGNGPNFNETTSIGFGLRLSTTWGVQLAIFQQAVRSSYKTATDSHTFSQSGFGGAGSVLFYF